jgi:hypothetical protein
LVDQLVVAWGKASAVLSVSALVPVLDDQWVVVWVTTFLAAKELW